VEFGIRDKVAAIAAVDSVLSVNDVDADETAVASVLVFAVVNRPVAHAYTAKTRDDIVRITIYSAGEGMME